MDTSEELKAIEKELEEHRSTHEQLLKEEKYEHAAEVASLAEMVLYRKLELELKRQRVLEVSPPTRD